MSTRRYGKQNSPFKNTDLDVVWAAINMLDVTDRMRILEALAQETATAFISWSASARETRAVVSLYECRSLIGHSPSVGEYERERLAAPSNGWPPEVTVRRWLGAGSWNKALDRAGLDPVAGGDVIMKLVLGNAFTADEAILALRQCAGDLGGGAPTHHELIRWAHSPEVMSRPGRRPLAPQVYIRLFGSYLQALEAAGLCGDSHAVSAHGSFRMIGGYTLEDLLDALREVATRIGHAPTRSEYRRERRAIEKESHAAGAPRTIAGEDAIARAFGGDWSAAIVAAGLADAAGARMVRPPRYTDEEILETLREARREVGDPFTSSVFRVWRPRRIAEAEAAGTPRYIPSFELVRSRFGTWTAAMALAFPAPSVEELPAPSAEEQ